MVGPLLTVSTILLMGQTVFCRDLCKDYPETDPCLPGGVWDPLLKRCMGYSLMPCYQCYSGEYCKTKESPLQCNLMVDDGNPIYIAEYWIDKLSKMAEPCISTPAHYRPGYQYPVDSKLETHDVLSPLRDAIEDLHSVTGNAETSGYSLVGGMGATMVIYTAVSAISQRILNKCRNESHNCPDVVDVFAQAPHYQYPVIVEQIPHTRWNTSANATSPFTIEILTYPNNPNGAKRSPLVTDPSHVVWDMVYYWPMYTEVDVKLSHPLMIFSSSKHDGLAGTRFGWGLVQDKDLAEDMFRVVNSLVLSLSVDIQLRVLNSLEAILSEGNTSNSILPFHAYGQQVIASRFKQLSDMFSSCPGLSLDNHLLSTGGYAWVSCSSALGTCVDVFQRVNLRGISGDYFGATKNEIRFTMLLPTVEFDTMAVKIKSLCSLLSFHHRVW